MQVAPAGPSELSLPYPRLTSLQRQGDRAQSLDEHEYIALLDEAGLCIQKMSLVLGADNQLIISGTTAAKAEAAYVAAALAVMCGRFRKYDGKAAAWSMAVSACGKDTPSATSQAEKWIARLEQLDAALAMLDPSEQTLHHLQQQSTARRRNAEADRGERRRAEGAEQAQAQRDTQRKHNEQGVCVKRVLRGLGRSPPRLAMART